MATFPVTHAETAAATHISQTFSVRKKAKQFKAAITYVLRKKLKL